MGILDAPGYSRVAADKQFQRKASNTIALLGDSFTDMSEDTTGVNSYRAGRGFLTWAMQRLGQRLQIVSAPGTANGGITGQTTTQILARVQQDVIDVKPGWAHVLAGTNDMITGVAFGTIQANLTAIYDAILGAGIRLIVGTIAPYSGATTAQLIAIERINNFIREQALTRPGVVLADYHAVLAGADGNWRTVGTTAYTGDGTHASTGGAMRMGKVLAEALASQVPAVNILPTSNVDAIGNAASFDKPNLLTNPMFTGTAGTVGTQATGQVADSWVVSTYTASDLTGVTASKVARADNQAGTWQQFTLTNVSQKLRFQQSINMGTNLAAGDLVWGAIEYELSSITDLDLFRVQLATFDAANGFANRGTVIDLDLNGADINTIPLDTNLPATGILRTPTLTMPANATGITFSFDVSAVGTIRLGRPVFRRTRP
jgi:lysophospholipase L1-like esterase